MIHFRTDLVINLPSPCNLSCKDKPYVIILDNIFVHETRFFNNTWPLQKILVCSFQFEPNPLSGMLHKTYRTFMEKPRGQTFIFSDLNDKASEQQQS